MSNRALSSITSGVRSAAALLVAFAISTAAHDSAAEPATASSASKPVGDKQPVWAVRAEIQRACGGVAPRAPRSRSGQGDDHPALLVRDRRRHRSAAGAHSSRSRSLGAHHDDGARILGQRALGRRSGSSTGSRSVAISMHIDSTVMRTRLFATCAWWSPAAAGSAAISTRHWAAASGCRFGSSATTRATLGDTSGEEQPHATAKSRSATL